MPSGRVQLLLRDIMLLFKMALDFANRKSNCEVGMGRGVSNPCLGEISQPLLPWVALGTVRAAVPPAFTHYQLGVKL